MASHTEPQHQLHATDHLDFFHQLHHRYFECNYGTVEMPWDRWFGTFHDGSEEGTVRTRAFKKQMYKK